MSCCIGRFILVVLLALPSMCRGIQSQYAAGSAPVVVAKTPADTPSSDLVRLAGDFYISRASRVAPAGSASTGSLGSAAEVAGADSDSASDISVASDDATGSVEGSWSLGAAIDSEGDIFEVGDICDADGEPMTSAEVYGQVSGEIEILCRKLSVAAQTMDRDQLIQIKSQAQHYAQDPRCKWLAVNRTDDASDLFVDLRNLNLVIDNVLSLDADVTAFVNEVVRASRVGDRATLLSLRAQVGKLKADDRFKIIEIIRLENLETALDRVQVFLDRLIARPGRADTTAS